MLIAACVVAPQSVQPVARLNRGTGKREFALLRWGLMPFWILLANSGCLTEVA
jgi:putative SOS response-associated peptidase YedK